jgi:hypothetical protein
LRKKYNIAGDFEFNCDETMLRGLKDPRKVAAYIGSEAPVVTSTPVTEHITFLFCVSAAGEFVSPLVILPLKHLPMNSNPEMIRLKGKWSFAHEKSGWINGETFRNFMLLVFIPFVEAHRVKVGKLDAWALLITDGHTSRNAVTYKDIWEDKKIIVLELPPHSSAILQPLDLSVNIEFKRVYSNVYEHKSEDTAPERRLKMLLAAEEACSIALASHTIKVGFKRTGLWPYDPSKVLGNKMLTQVRAPTITEVKKKHKRGPGLMDGRIMFDGILLPTAPQHV